MNKSQRFLRSIVSMATVFVVFSFVFVFVLGVNAASTIGTNMSTTGTFTVTPATNSATSVQFQNAASSTYFYADSTNRRVGIGGAPFTVFEVQGTASASYLLSANSLEVGGGGRATVSYSRFGTGTTGHSLTAVDDVLFTGLVEFDDKVFFDGTASVASDFEVTGYASASQGFFTTDIIVGGNVASSSSTYVAEFGEGSGTATVSLLFGSSSASSKGTCLQMKDMDGKWVYLRVSAESGVTSSMSLVINNTRCQ